LKIELLFLNLQFFFEIFKKNVFIILFYSYFELGGLAAATGSGLAAAARGAANARLAATGFRLAATFRLALRTTTRLAATRFTAMTVASRFAFDGMFELLVTRGAFGTVVRVSMTQRGHFSAALALRTTARLGLARGTALTSPLALAHTERSRLLTTGLFEASVSAAAARNILLQVMPETRRHSGVPFEVRLKTANTGASGTRPGFSRRFTFSHVFI
tara:strand:+ start:12795 stop:13445 length:651 start_codon:yes stop_codon:yes gene_type:complete